jgi:non-lysosomal glucosylceramidase
MSSWGVLTALAGHEYHGPQGRLAFAPRRLGDAASFKCAFTAAEGWGTFEQRSDGGNEVFTIELKHGKLRLAELGLAPWAQKRAGASAQVRVNGEARAAQATADGNRIKLTFAEPVELAEAQKLEVTL